MTAITRRNALVSAGAAVVAGVPGAVRAGKSPLDDAKTREALAASTPIRRSVDGLRAIPASKG